MVDVFAALIGGLAYVEGGGAQNHAPRASLLAALLFAAHPVHTESVAGVVGRADLLCALFFQLSFLTYCKAFHGGSDRCEGKFSLQWMVLSLLLCAAAMLCKEQGITVLGINAAFDVLLICNVNVFELSQRLLLRRKSIDVSELVRSGLLSRLAVLVVGGASMFYARWRIMGTGPPAFTEVDNPASFADSMFLRIVNYNYYYSLNAWLLLCPWWLCFDWSMGCVPLINSATDWRIVWLLLLWCVLIGLISQALCSPDSQRRRTLTLGLVLLVVPFLPACNLFFRVGFVVAERVLYLSSAGYCLLLAYALGHCCCRWPRHRRLLGVCVLALLGVYVVRCAHRSHQWRSERSLFTSALLVCPLNAKVHYNVGKNLADRGNTSAAISYYREAVRLHPTYVHAMNNLGNILKEQDELVEAELLLSKAVAIQPDFAAAWMNLGIVQNSLQKFREAERSYWNAIHFRKKYPDCYYNLGRLYADQNRHLEALNAWKNATVLKPDHSLAWNNMVILLDNTGESFRSLSFQYRIGYSTIARIVSRTGACEAIHQVLMEEFLQLKDSLKNGSSPIVLVPLMANTSIFNPQDTVVVPSTTTKKLLYLSVGAQGRASDAGLFVESDIKRALDNGLIHFPPESLPNTEVVVPYMFLGDDVYPTQRITDLMKPYSFRQMDQDQSIFKYHLSRACRVVENPFDILGKGWRFFPLHNSPAPRISVKITMAAVSLHNFLSEHQSEAYVLPDREPCGGILEESGTRGNAPLPERADKELKLSCKTATPCSEGIICFSRRPGNLGQAELIGREALKLLPNDHTIMFSLANVLGKLQKYKESEGFFLLALKINPNAASCHGNLAVLYHRWGKMELAKRHYELALKLDPEAPGTRDNYKMLLRKMEQLRRTGP
ncbi:Transmembrane and TPR repeat-containing protein 4 [Merluccius polli]|uniref:dolichyl-phosphate-mannose--protein mannosyltransferase n=1 Tax=Merluccius polli TaxID=89951 RepID=A0AA47NRI4_MERPO|nr:Transmembrane and TPR repeat-containing protein 4 [Merluccius polli]